VCSIPPLRCCPPPSKPQQGHAHAAAPANRVPLCFIPWCGHLAMPSLSRCWADAFPIIDHAFMAPPHPLPACRTPKYGPPIRVEDVSGHLPSSGATRVGMQLACIAWKGRIERSCFLGPSPSVVASVMLTACTALTTAILFQLLGACAEGLHACNLVRSLGLLLCRCGLCGFVGCCGLCGFV
jgi:hypothetical protein